MESQNGLLIPSDLLTHSLTTILNGLILTAMDTAIIGKTLSGMKLTKHGALVWLFTSTPDACPFITGTSSSDRYGCTDSDGDSFSDGDLNWTVVNGSDAFPNEPSQWTDRDFDGWGDNQTFGALFIDDFPDNPTQWRDTDKDGWGDNQTYGATQIDDFPFIPSQYRDTDGDGYGDNIFGFEGDVCVFSTPEE